MGLGPQFEQLSMFMTPSQIMEDYAPLEGDRHDVFERLGHNRLERDEEVWERKGEEASMPRGEYRRELIGEEPRGTNTSFFDKLERGELGTGVPYRTGHTSTFEAEDAEWMDNKYTEFSGERTREAETSLVDSIRESGVQMPVRVGPTQVTGGHHRIAAAHSINPDMLIPVLHEPEDMPIRSSKAYPYT
jgi:hypothetical protein